MNEPWCRVKVMNEPWCRVKVLRYRLMEWSDGNWIWLLCNWTGDDKRIERYRLRSHIKSQTSIISISKAKYRPRCQRLRAEENARLYRNGSSLLFIWAIFQRDGTSSGYNRKSNNRKWSYCWGQGDSFTSLPEFSQKKKHQLFLHNCKQGVKCTRNGVKVSTTCL